MAPLKYNQRETNCRVLKIAAQAWAPGTKLQTIIVDGWSRGF